MRPLKASLFFVYCLAAIAAVGTAVSHLWTTTKLYRDDSLRGAAASQTYTPAPAAPPAAESAPVTAPAAAQPS